jgi:hypothetical protein
MSRLPHYVLEFWACSVSTQLIVLLLLFLKANFRKLPFLTTYVALNICQALCLAVAYSVWGIDSPLSFRLGWYSESVTLLAQALATTEILRITLLPYQGIWGLAWRALAGTSATVIILVALATYGHWASAGWFQLNRGYHLTFATAVIACLFVVRYYSIPVPTSYKMLLGGFCFYSCTEILINTILQAFLKKSFDAYQPIWQSATMASFVAGQALWMVALWKPLPADERKAPPRMDSTYQNLSPSIDEKLRDINEKLLRLWKLEARPN